LVNLLDLLDSSPDPPSGEKPTVGKCVCGKKIWDPVSLHYGLGRECREKAGIKPRRPVRVTRVPAWRDCEGQTDLLETDDDA
jgi:hypothetical protein